MPGTISWAKENNQAKLVNYVLTCSRPGDRLWYALVTVAITGSDDDLSSIWCHAMVWTNNGLLFGSLWPYSNRFRQKVHHFHQEKCIWNVVCKIASICPYLIMLTGHISIDELPSLEALADPGNPCALTIAITTSASASTFTATRVRYWSGMQTTENLWAKNIL